MINDSDSAGERNILMNRLLDAVKQCQVRFGGKRELATDGDSRVSCLCAAWEAVLQHGMLHTKRALSTFKQVTELTGLTGVLSEIRNMETEPVFWHYVREHLTRHEHERFLHLKAINTEVGRGRAWLRSALNEASLEKYMHMLISSDALLVQFYGHGAFLRDQECGSMLPMMAAGLTSILFAINIDNEELNSIKRAQGLDFSFSPVVDGLANDVDRERPVIATDSREKGKEKKKKKKVPTLISFDEETKLKSIKKPTVDLPPIKRLNLSLGLVTDQVSPSPCTAQQGSAAQRGVSSDKLSNSLTNLYSENDVFADSDSAHAEPAPPSHASMFSDRRRILSKDDSFSDTTSVYMSAPTSPISVTDSSQFSNYDSSAVDPPLMTSHDSVTAYDVATSTSRRKLSSTASESSRVSVESDLCFSSSYQPLVMVPVMSAIDDVIRPSPSSSERGADDNLSNDSDSGPLYLSSYNTQLISTDGARRPALKDRTLQGLRTAGDGSTAPDFASGAGGAPEADAAISSGDLRQAVVAMMIRKDEVEEQNRSLRTMLDQEIESCRGLHAELEELRLSHRATDEAAQHRITALTRDNDLLKHQLKKYVNAVQLLRREGISAEARTGIHLDAIQPPIPAPRAESLDNSHEVNQYELKLIQVAEMHGELMEFNERLHIALNAKEQLVEQMRKQLEELRGPLPALEAVSAGADAAAHCLSTARPLINLWIPSVFYRGRGTDAHHAYQIYTRIGEEEWNVYRRYNEFYALHNQMKKSHPLIATFDFPKKKVLGNKDERFVEERRKNLQIYVRLVVNLLLRSDASLAADICKSRLIKIIPLLDDRIPEKDKRKARIGRTTGSLLSPASRVREDSTPALYTGI